MPPKPSSVKADKVPAGWYSREQLEKAWKLSQSRTSELLGAAVRRKEAKVKKFKTRRPTGVYLIPYYRFKD